MTAISLLTPLPGTPGLPPAAGANGGASFAPVLAALLTPGVAAGATLPPTGTVLPDTGTILPSADAAAAADLSLPPALPAAQSPTGNVLARTEALPATEQAPAPPRADRGRPMIRTLHVEPPTSLPDPQTPAAAISEAQDCNVAALLFDCTPVSMTPSPDQTIAPPTAQLPSPTPPPAIIADAQEPVVPEVPALPDARVNQVAPLHVATPASTDEASPEAACPEQPADGGAQAPAINPLVVADLARAPAAVTVTTPVPAPTPSGSAPSALPLIAPASRTTPSAKLTPVPRERDSGAVPHATSPAMPHGDLPVRADADARAAFAPPVPVVPPAPVATPPLARAEQGPAPAVVLLATSATPPPHADQPAASSPIRTDRSAPYADAQRTSVPPPASPIVVVMPALQAFGAALQRAVLAERRPHVPMEEAIGTVSIPALMPASAPVAIAAAPLDMAQARWPEAMVARIEQIRDAQNAPGTLGDTRIRLHPDALGAVEVQLRRDADGIHVRLHAAEPATRALLADAQPRLAELADAKGLRLAGSDVGGHDRGAQPQARHQPATQTQPAAASPRLAEADADTRLA